MARVLLPVGVTCRLVKQHLAGVIQGDADGTSMVPVVGVPWLAQ